MQNFSVVIPLYNKEKSIASTIESILMQTYQNFEIIIVDDGSTDNSLKIAREYENDRIRIFSKSNEGKCSARNFGIKKAKYLWIALIDADDLWIEDHLEVNTNLINRYPTVKVFSTSFIFDTAMESYESKNEVYVLENYFKEATTKPIMCSSTSVINMKCFHDIGFFNESLSRGEDLEMWARLARKYQIVKSDQITAIYRTEAENRAMNTYYPFNKSYASIISFKGVTDIHEMEYLKGQIRAKMKSCLYNKEWGSLLKLICKFKFNLI